MTSENPYDHAVYHEVFLREARKLVTAYNFSNDVEVSVLAQGENTILSVDDRGEDKQYVLRINSHQLSYHQPEMIRSEVAWLRALRHDSDIVAPDPVPAKDGSFVQTLVAPELDQPRCAVMMTFLTGEEPDPDGLLEGFDRLGEIAARMHRHAKSWARPASFIRPTWAVRAILDDEYKWGWWREGYDMDEPAQALLERAGETILARLAKLEPDAERFGLSHFDLRLSNTLIEGEATKVIDFDDSGFSWYLYDIAPALTLLEDRPDVDELVATWLAGYRRVAEVPRDMEAEIPSFIMLRRIHALGWLGSRRHLEFSQQWGPGYTKVSCELAEAYLAKHG